MTLLETPSEIVLASGNKKKIVELEKLLSPLKIKIKPQKEYGVSDAVEDGLTFVENAIIKARHACVHSGKPAIADDSGIEVDALNGQPGIYSARYAAMNQRCSEDADDKDKQNNILLLENLKGVSEENRSARFQCVLVYMRHAEDPTPIICQGTWEGFILENEIGSGGFGYDPLFFVPTENCASAELSSEVKGKLSHRGQAMEQLLEKMQRLYSIS